MDALPMEWQPLITSFKTSGRLNDFNLQSLFGRFKAHEEEMLRT